MTREILEPKIRGRFQSIYNWFVSDGTDENEASRIFDETNEIIRKMLEMSGIQNVVTVLDTIEEVKEVYE